MSDMECESLLLDDPLGKCSEGSDYGDICNADEDALLADLDEPDVISKKPAHFRKSISFVDQEADVLDLGTLDVELDEDEAPRKENSNIMTVSSTTPADPSNVSIEEEDERETRFKQERQVITATKKYANIPESLDDVLIDYPQNNNNQKTFRGRGRGRGYQNNNNNYNQRKPGEAKTVLINPHYKGKARLNWDARERLNNHNYRNQASHASQFVHPDNGRVEQVWAEPSNLQQPAPPQYQQFIPPQIYNHQPVLPYNQFSNNWNQLQGNTFQQVPQQLQPTFQPPQQCFIQPLHEPFYSQQPQFVPPPQFNNPPPQFQQQMPQFPSDQPQYTHPSSIRMLPYNNNNPPQFIAPQNQVIHPSIDPYCQPMFNQTMQHSNLPRIPAHNPEYLEANRPKHLYQSPNNKRKVLNNGIVRKNKKRNPMVFTNLQEVRTIQVPDTTVKDDEDEETKKYRQLIEQQKKQRELILKQKETRRRLAVLADQNVPSALVPIQLEEGVVPTIQRQNRQKLVPKSSPFTSRVVQNLQTIQRVPSVSAVTPILKQSGVRSFNESNHEKEHISSFLTNRKILAKDESLIDTNIVIISNLTDGTTAVKLRKMCVGIGDIKNLQMSPKERQATIQFNSVASAHTFFKKYQRTMLDLSVIQVTLKPMA